MKSNTIPFLQSNDALLALPSCCGAAAALVQVVLQHQIEQDEQEETVGESEEVGGMSATVVTKKMVGDTRKYKELEKKRVQLETYAH